MRRATPLFRASRMVCLFFEALNAMRMSHGSSSASREMLTRCPSSSKKRRHRSLVTTFPFLMFCPGASINRICMLIHDTPSRGQVLKKAPVDSGACVGIVFRSARLMRGTVSGCERPCQAVIAVPASSREVAGNSWSARDGARCRRCRSSCLPRCRSQGGRGKYAWS